MSFDPDVHLSIDEVLALPDWGWEVGDEPASNSKRAKRALLRLMEAGMPVVISHVEGTCLVFSAMDVRYRVPRG